jgi:hypothetical protein
MTRINLNSSNALRSIRGSREFLAWGKTINAKTINTKTNNAKQISTNLVGNINALIFAAVLIACSITVGCSSDKPKQVSTNSQIPMTQSPSPVAPTPSPAPVMQAENKPAPKKVVHKKPATVNYTDKTYGVTFEYPRRYAIETGDAATDLLTSSNPIPMNFVQPGGVALAAVELPETAYTNTDFSSGFFDVSVHKGLTADQCGEFAVPQPKMTASAAAPVAATSIEGFSNSASTTQASSQINSSQVASSQTTSTEAPSTQAASSQSGSSIETSKTETSAAAVNTAASSDAKSNSEPSDAKSVNSQASASSSSVSEPQGSKLILGDLELRATEAVSGEGTRQSDAKYFHVYRNGACYEFAVNVTTVVSEGSITKHVDRDKVFATLEKILATVKIDEAKADPTTAPATPSAATPEISAAAPAASASQENPAQ